MRLALRNLSAISTRLERVMNREDQVPNAADTHSHEEAPGDSPAEPAAAADARDAPPATSSDGQGDNNPILRKPSKADQQASIEAIRNYFSTPPR